MDGAAFSTRRRTGQGEKFPERGRDRHHHADVEHPGDADDDEQRRGDHGAVEHAIDPLFTLPVLPADPVLDRSGETRRRLGGRPTT